METVDRRKNISYLEFIEEYQNKGIPVILENATEVWASPYLFTPDFFREHFGQRTTTSGGVTYTIAEILDLTANSTKENPAPYPIKFNIAAQLPELLDFMRPLDLNLIKPNWLKIKLLQNKLGNAMDLHIGGAGNSYDLHKDAYDVHAWLIQLYGEKEVIVFPREQEALLYPKKGGILESRSPIDVSNPDYTKYPNYKLATPLRLVLKAGELLYIPNGIWHTTLAHTQNISTIIDQVNNTNYKTWRRDAYVYKKDQNKLRAAFDYTAVSVIGNACRIGQLFGKKF